MEKSLKVKDRVEKEVEETEEAEPLLKQENQLETDEEKIQLQTTKWAHRRNRCIPKLSNRTCCLWSCATVLIFLLLVVLPIFLLVIVPQSIKMIIDNAPAAYINVLDIQHFYRHNSSGAVWFQADLDLRAPGVYCEPSSYHVSLLFPQSELQAPLDLAYLDLGSFETSLSAPINLDFFTVLHNVNTPNMRYAFKLAADHFTHDFIGNNSAASLAVDDSTDLQVQSRVPKTIYRLHLETKTHVNLFGIRFPKVLIKYDIGLNFSTKSFLARFQPQIQKCIVSINGNVKSCEDIGQDMPGDDDDDDQFGMGFPSFDIKAELTVSILNPTVFGLNLGRVEIDLKTPKYNLGTLMAENFDVKQTKRSKSIRQDVTLHLINVNINAFGHLMDAWGRNKSAHVLLDPKGIRLYGYPDENIDGDENRITWLEDILSDFEVTIPIPRPAFLPNPSSTSDSSPPSISP